MELKLTKEQQNKIDNFALKDAKNRFIIDDITGIHILFLEIENKDTIIINYEAISEENFEVVGKGKIHMYLKDII